MNASPLLSRNHPPTHRAPTASYPALRALAITPTSSARCLASRRARGSPPARMPSGARSAPGAPRTRGPCSRNAGSAQKTSHGCGRRRGGGLWIGLARGSEGWLQTSRIWCRRRAGHFSQGRPNKASSPKFEPLHGVIMKIPCGAPADACSTEV